MLVNIAAGTFNSSPGQLGKVARRTVFVHCQLQSGLVHVSMHDAVFMHTCSTSKYIQEDGTARSYHVPCHEILLFSANTNHTVLPENTSGQAEPPQSTLFQHHIKRDLHC